MGGEWMGRWANELFIAQVQVPHSLLPTPYPLLLTRLTPYSLPSDACLCPNILIE